MYKIVTLDEETGMTVTQEDQFETSAEAEKEATELIERWAEFGQDFWVEPYEPEPYKEPRTYAYPNSVDGWEDIYPTRD